MIWSRVAEVRNENGQPITGRESCHTASLFALSQCQCAVLSHPEPSLAQTQGVKHQVVPLFALLIVFPSFSFPPTPTSSAHTPSYIIAPAGQLFSRSHAALITSPNLESNGRSERLAQTAHRTPVQNLPFVMKIQHRFLGNSRTARRVLLQGELSSNSSS